MNFGRESLRPLLIPAVIAVALVGLGIVVLSMTDRVLKESNNELMRARTERLSMQTRLSQATDEERLIRERIADYQRIRQKGVLGDERRLDWIETIKEIRNDRRLYDVKYAIEPRRAVDYPGFRGSNDVDFLVSPLRLEVQLLHEGDLLNLLSDIRTRLAPHVIDRSCRIDRLQPSGTAPSLGPKLRAECTLDLVTIRDRSVGSL